MEQPQTIDDMLEEVNEATKRIAADSKLIVSLNKDIKKEHTKLMKSNAGTRRKKAAPKDPNALRKSPLG